MVGVDEVDSGVLVSNDDLAGFEFRSGEVVFYLEGVGVSDFADNCCLRRSC